MGVKKNPGSMWVSENYLGFGFVCKSIMSYVNQIDTDIPFICHVFWCYNTLICHVMQISLPTNEICDKIGSISRLFLSYFYHLDKNIQSRTYSKIETAACVISVLSLDKEMRDKGMHRNYWEGGWFGEGGFRCVKPLIKRGTHQIGVFSGTMSKIYQVRAILEMISNDDILEIESLSIGHEVSENDFSDTSRYRRFCCYRNIHEIEIAIERKDPFALFYHIASDTFFVCILKKKAKYLLKLVLFNFSIELDTSVFDVFLENSANAKAIDDVSMESSEYRSVLMLPLCYGMNDEDIKYYAIGDDHYEYTSDSNWKLPQILIEQNVFTETLNENASEISLDIINVWDSVDKINELVGMSVESKEGSTSGVITSCYFINGIHKDSHARWSVTYYDGEEIEGNISEIKTYTATEIADITLM